MDMVIIPFLGLGLEKLSWNRAVCFDTVIFASVQMWRVMPK